MGLPGVAEVDMRVDEPWCCNHARSVNNTSSPGIGTRGLDGLDRALFDQDIADLVESRGGVDDAAVADQDRRGREGAHIH